MKRKQRTNHTQQHTMDELDRVILILIGIAALVFCVSLTAHAAGPNDWTTFDTSLQAIYTVAHVLDWGQTRNIVARRDEGYWERNPYLGRHPSAREVNVYFASTLALHTMISVALPRDYRSLWQMFWIGVEANQVSRNYSIGLRASF